MKCLVNCCSKPVCKKTYMIIFMNLIKQKRIIISVPKMSNKITFLQLVCCIIFRDTQTNSSVLHYCENVFQFNLTSHKHLQEKLH